MTSSKPMESHRRSSWVPDVIFGFGDSAVQARALAAAVGATYGEVDVHTFPDGESRVQVLEISAPSLHRVLLYRSLHHPNAKILEILLAASALRDAGAAEIGLVAPYLPYMRQDMAFHVGEAVSQKVVGQVLAAAFDRFIAVDPHLHRTHNLGDVFGGKPALALTGAHVMATHIGQSFVPGALIVGPDQESAPLVRNVAARLGVEWFVATKQRLGDRLVQIALPAGVSVHGRAVVIVDDVISSGRTVVDLVEKLTAGGAGTIGVCATHALFDDGAAAAMKTAGVMSIASCDGVPHASNRISLVQVIADGLRNSHDD